MNKKLLKEFKYLKKNHSDQNVDEFNIENDMSMEKSICILQKYFPELILFNPINNLT